ncbi:hypothetical protein [Streptomyces termitum]|uniref:hypothetical protein n=1 Tax=Streptomyces termitum TaxID=67368 RepID=UPI0037B2465E
MAWYEGPCRITVIGVDADWPQRAVVTVSGPRGARIEIPGVAGTVRHVDAAGWHLNVEHQYEGRWRPNIRAVRSRWETVDGVRTQTITSKDVDWPGGNQHERNLVLLLEQVGEGARRPGERAGEAGRGAPSRAVTQSEAETPLRRAASGPASVPTGSVSGGSVFGTPPGTSGGTSGTASGGASGGATSTSSSSPW